MQICISLAIGVVLCGCTKVNEWSEGHEYLRTSGVDGCLTFLGPPADRNVVPGPDLLPLLLDQLKGHPLPKPVCWYEKPRGELFLRAGNMCAGPTEASFSRNSTGWNLEAVEDDVYWQCERRK